MGKFQRQWVIPAAVLLYATYFLFARHKEVKTQASLQPPASVKTEVSLHSNVRINQAPVREPAEVIAARKKRAWQAWHKKKSEKLI